MLSRSYTDWLLSEGLVEVCGDMGGVTGVAKCVVAVMLLDGPHTE